MSVVLKKTTCASLQTHLDQWVVLVDAAISCTNPSIERADAIMKVQQKISNEISQKKIGKTFKALFDRKEGDYFIGRTEFDSPEVDNEVLIDAAKNYVRIGDFSNIKIISSEDFDLYGSKV